VYFAIDLTSSLGVMVAGRLRGGQRTEISIAYYHDLRDHSVNKQKDLTGEKRPDRFSKTCQVCDDSTGIAV
jgi:hypothetical protein